MPERRDYDRIDLKCRIKLEHPAIGELTAITRNISDQGVFVLLEPAPELEEGMVVRGQVQGMPVEAPVVDMEIVRIEAEGLGLRFCNNDA